MNEEKLTELKESFVDLFKEEPDEKRLKALLRFHNEDEILSALAYLSVKGIREPEKGIERNPYSLLLALCKSYKEKYHGRATEK